MAAVKNLSSEEASTPNVENISLSKEEEEQSKQEAEEAVGKWMDEIRHINHDFGELNRDKNIKIFNFATGDDSHETFISEEEKQYLFDGYLERFRGEKVVAKKAALAAKATASSEGDVKDEAEK
ncbi:MAG: hypothetical protein Q9166_005093 [cf. Caloplaca sp. 2 TL-2023]